MIIYPNSLSTQNYLLWKELRIKLFNYTIVWSVFGQNVERSDLQKYINFHHNVPFETYIGNVASLNLEGVLIVYRIN